MENVQEGKDIASEVDTRSDSQGGQDISSEVQTRSDSQGIQNIASEVKTKSDGQGVGDIVCEMNARTDDLGVQDNTLTETNYSKYEHKIKRKHKTVEGKPKKFKSAARGTVSSKNSVIDITAGIKVTAQSVSEDISQEPIETMINIFKNLEMLESVELLTEYLARRFKASLGQNNIVGDLVSGYNESLGVYYCSECKYIFPFEEYYMEHKKVGQCIFVCLSCGESFPFKNYSSYLKHLKTHDNDGTSILSSLSGPPGLPSSEQNKEIPKNTLRVNQCVAVKLRKYLENLNEDSHFENLDEYTLAAHLKGFYEDVKTRDGEKFKVTSFENLRYSLARYLKSHPSSAHIDILNGEAFVEANIAFNKVLSTIKDTKKGVEEQHHQVSREDLIAIYNCEYLHPGTPLGLLNRVQMNVRLFFSRRSRDYLERMMKDTFMVDVFPTGKRCVVRRNELINEYMPEDLDDPEFCPVRTFELYLSKLNPSCDKLWQMPKENYKLQDRTWYQNKNMGRDTLAKFMAKLKEKVPLSLNYTNHSIRLTGNSFYTRLKFTPEKIHQTTKLSDQMTAGLL